MFLMIWENEQNFLDAAKFLKTTPKIQSRNWKKDDRCKENHHDWRIEGAMRNPIPKH